MTVSLSIAIFAAGALIAPADAAASGPTGTVTASVRSYYIISSGTNRFEIVKERAPGLMPGDIVRIPPPGRVDPYTSMRPDMTEFALIGHAELPTPPLSDLADIDAVKTDKKNVRVRGWVKDARLDPLDEEWMRLVLKSGKETVDVAVPIPPNAPITPDAYRHADIEVTGLYRRKISGGRRFATASIETSDVRDIAVLSRPSDPYDQPSIDSLKNLSATEILAANACTASGTVYAVWEHRSFLLRTTSQADPLVRVDLAHGEPPRFGQHVQAVGDVHTDLHHIRLTDAQYRVIPGSGPSPEPVSRHAADEIGNNVYRHGTLTSVTGIVRDVATDGPKRGVLKLELPSGRTASADISSLGRFPDGLAPGCTLSLTAVCIAETDPWRPGGTLETFRSMTLVPQTDRDVRVVARAPWWTPARLTAVILLLTAVLLGIAVWNRVLMKLVSRRGHELFRSEHARACALLRVNERTRLATELHDSLSQSLSGIACQVGAAAHALGGDPSAVRGRLTAAQNMLASCRGELANCLFDLRGDMLEERDFTVAVKKSLALVSGAENRMTVRMNIPRARLHDATAHAILCIVRELASNALRHGAAANVRIEGALENGEIRFSVTDDGTGFDPARCPGPEDGHFGLSGVRDRVRRLNGTVAIERVAPHGTRITITLPAPADTSRTDI